MTASEYLKSPAAVSKIAEFVSHLRQLEKEILISCNYT